MKKEKTRRGKLGCSLVVEIAFVSCFITGSTALNRTFNCGDNKQTLSSLLDIRNCSLKVMAHKMTKLGYGREYNHRVTLETRLFSLLFFTISDLVYCDWNNIIFLCVYGWYHFYYASINTSHVNDCEYNFFFLKIVPPVVIVNSIHFFQGFAQRKIQSKVLYKLLEHWMP